MNIYQMYYANQKKFGFWIQRNSWENWIAKVISIEGVIEGEEISGRKPYHGNPKVFAQFYRQTEIGQCNDNNIEFIREVLCPGNFTYDML